MKILLLSVDKILSEKILKTGIVKDYELAIQNISEPKKINIENFDLIIFDINGLNKKKEEDFSAFLLKLNNLNVLSLVIMDLKQAGLLSKIHNSGIRIDDILIADRLEKEIKLRINFLLSSKRLENPENSIAVYGLVLNLDKYELSVNGVEIELTFKEYELLKILLENQNRVFSRNKLLSTVWGYDFYGGSRTVDVHMRRLRSKLEPPYCDMLKTIRNVGYMFSPTI